MKDHLQLSCRLQPTFVNKNEKEKCFKSFPGDNLVSHSFSLPGFEIQQVIPVEGQLPITATAIREGAACPTCGQSSRSIHSWYQRFPQDLPSSGQVVRLHLHVRRFRCRNKACPRQTFAERLPEVVPVSVQRTTRLTVLLKTIAIAINAKARLSFIGSSCDPCQWRHSLTHRQTYTPAHPTYFAGVGFFKERSAPACANGFPSVDCLCVDAF